MAEEFLPAERDLAAGLGVSRETVRLAIEQLCRDGLVRREGRRGNRVLERAGPVNRGLCALLIYDMSRGGSAAIFRGAQMAMQRAGYHLIVCETWRPEASDAESEAAQLRGLMEQRVDGLLLYLEPNGENAALVEQALVAGIHVILLDRFLPGLECDYVGVDNGLAAQDAVRHLVEQGHERIAFLANHPAATTVHERRAGYEQALASAGLNVDPALIASVTGGSDVDVYRQVVRRWKALSRPPTAVFAVNDRQAWECIEACRAEGWGVPRDLAVVGFDNSSLATLVQPALTTVAEPFLHMGETGASLLQDRIEGRYRGGPRRVLLPTQLVIRETTPAPQGLLVGKEAKPI